MVTLASNLPGDVLLSRLPAEQVPLALEGLTAVFGMGTGVSPPPSSPDYMKELWGPRKVLGLSFNAERHFLGLFMLLQN